VPSIASSYRCGTSLRQLWVTSECDTPMIQYNTATTHYNTPTTQYNTDRMDLITKWSELVESRESSVSGQYYVSQIDTYAASPMAYHYWRGKLAKAGWKGGFLFCQDLVLVGEDGLQVRVMLSPGSNAVHTGQILEGLYISVNKLTKIPYGDHHFLVLNGWEGGKSFQLLHRGQALLPGYPGQDKPLGNPHTDLLCPWTCASFLWSAQSPLRMKPSVLCARYDPTHHNLYNLDQCWHTLAKAWPLVVRVLAKSKDRLIIQQDNHRKPWLALTNLLVADTTAYSVLTVWDEAVSALYQTVREGDILVLSGRYRMGRYRPANQKLMYRLAPKVRHHALSPTEMELKLNPGDLDCVQLVHCAATCPSVPSPLWNFLSSVQLVAGGLALHQLVDYVGLVVYHGRWEREKCLDQSNTHTGQYWVRVWLLVGDHTSEEVVAVKLYVDRERWDDVEGALPGHAVVLTNLLYVRTDQGTLSHLECSNESQIFSGNKADDSRFGNSELVLNFRKALLQETDRWGQMLREKGGFGGNLHPPVKIQVTLRITGFVMRTREDMNTFLSSLAYRGCGRVLVRAKLSDITVYRVTSHGELELESVEGDSDDRYEGEVLCESMPTGDSLVRAIAGLNRASLGTAVREYCYMDTRHTGTERQHTLVREGHIAMVRLVIEDCHAMVQAELSCLEAVKRILETSEYVTGIFCLDLFRFRPQGLAQPASDGVEAVLRSVLGPQDQVEDSLIEADSDKSTLVNTIDLGNALL